MEQIRHLGHINKYKVDRETKLGYVLLDNQENEYFLHHNECKGQSFVEGDEVEAFIYVDKKGREAATLHLPTITLDKVGIGLVASSVSDLGVFINIGISKDILLSKDELPLSFKAWPKEGDKVACVMKVRANKLILRMASKKDIIYFDNKDINYAEGERVDGYVYRVTDEGINLVTEDLKVIFVYKANLRGFFHLGQKVNVKIVKKNIDDYNGTMIEEKSAQIQDDKIILLNFLNEHNGVMMITEESSPELISHLFHMSKSSFKHAIGGLLKDGKIEKLEDKIVLKD